MIDSGSEHVSKYRYRLVEPADYMPRTVRDLLTYLNKHIFDPQLTISDAMRACGIRDKNISAIFRYFVSVTPRSYVTRHRLQCARELIAEHGLTAGPAAKLVGYHGDRAFSKAFRRHYGVAPQSLRTAA